MEYFKWSWMVAALCPIWPVAVIILVAHGAIFLLVKWSDWRDRKNAEKIREKLNW